MKNIGNTLSKTFWILVLILPAVVIQFMAGSEMIISLIRGVHQYLPLYLGLLLIFKALGIIYPPMPGAVFTIASIPLIGWQWAYVIDIMGSILGTSVSFLFGKKYGYNILVKVIGKSIADKIIRIKLKPRNQIEAAFFLRLAGGGLLSDGLAWGGGLIGFKYRPFMIGHIMSHLITTLPVFYLMRLPVSSGSWGGAVLITIISWLIVYKFKGRYFE